MAEISLPTGFRSQAVVRDQLATPQWLGHGSLEKSIREVEAKIEQDINHRGLGKPDDAWKALVKSRARAMITLQFETIQNRMSASQVAALTFLNGQTEPMSLVAFKLHFFDKAATGLPSLHHNRTFEQWYEFLKAHGLVVPAEDSVGISVRCREFLKWRVGNGRSGPWFGQGAMQSPSRIAR